MHYILLSGIWGFWPRNQSVLGTQVITKARQYFCPVLSLIWQGQVSKSLSCHLHPERRSSLRGGTPKPISWCFIHQDRRYQLREPCWRYIENSCYVSRPVGLRSREDHPLIFSDCGKHVGRLQRFTSRCLEAWRKC